MTRNHLAVLKVPHARRGSKKGWPTWTGQVTPDLNARLMELLGARHRGDLVAEALEQYVARGERRKANDRRTTERRKDAAA